MLMWAVMSGTDTSRQALLSDHVLRTHEGDRQKGSSVRDKFFMEHSDSHPIGSVMT